MFEKLANKKMIILLSEGDRSFRGDPYELRIYQVRVIISLSGGDRSSVQLKLLVGLKGLTDLLFSRL